MIQYGDVFGAPLLLDHGTSEITHDLITKLFELPKRRELGDDCVLLRLPILEIKQFQVGVQGIVTAPVMVSVAVRVYRQCQVQHIHRSLLVDCIHDRSVFHRLHIYLCQVQECGEDRVFRM